MKVYDSAGADRGALRRGHRARPHRGTLYSRFRRSAAHYPKRWLPRVTLTVQPAVKMPLPTDVHARDRRRRLADEMLRIMQRMMFDARPRRTLFEAFLDAARAARPQDTHHRGRTPAARIVSRAAQSGRRDRAHRHAGEPRRRNVGVMLPNLSITVALVFGLTAQRRVAAMLNYSAGPEAMHAACVAAGIRTVITSRRFIGWRGSKQRCVRCRGSARLPRGSARQLRLADKLWVMRALFCAALGDAAAGSRRLWRSCFSPRAPKRAPKAWRSRTTRCSRTWRRCVR